MTRTLAPWIGILGSILEASWKNLGRGSGFGVPGASLFSGDLPFFSCSLNMPNSCLEFMFPCRSIHFSVAVISPMCLDSKLKNPYQSAGNRNADHRGCERF